MSGHDRDGSLLLTSPSSIFFAPPFRLPLDVKRGDRGCVGLDYMYMSFTSVIFNIFSNENLEEGGWKIVLLLDGNSRGILFEFRNII